MAGIREGIAFVGIVVGMALTAQGQLPQPTPGVSVELVDLFQMPESRTSNPTEDSRSQNNHARINFISPIPDDSGRWFVNDLRGQLYTVDPTDGQTNLYLDFNTTFDRFIIGGGLSTGLVSATPHPEFASNGKFYTIHVERHSGNPATPDFVAAGQTGSIGQHSVVLEWAVDDPTSNVFAGTRRELMRIATPSGNVHTLGEVAFNPTASPGDADYGLLYIAGGDAGYDAYGKGGSPQAQRADSIFGKILRIDPAGDNSSNGAYGIPSGNPHVGTAGYLPEIYATGFRNAHRISWDLETGTTIVTDIGQHSIEEVNLLHPGANYGWSQREGTFRYQNGSISPITPGTQDNFTYPVAQYDHSYPDSEAGYGIAGGFVYRGSLIPELVGKFVFGDIVHGRIFYSDLEEMLALDDTDPTTTAAVYELILMREGEPVFIPDLVEAVMDIGHLPRERVDLRLGQTPDGELYILTKQDGMVRQLVPEPAAGLLLGATLLLLTPRRR